VFDVNRLLKNKMDLLEAHDRILSLTNADQATFLADPRNSLAVKYLLVQAVEAISDSCQHLLGKGKGVACEGYVDCIIKAGEQGVISLPLSSKLRRLADLRNHLVHRYWIINDADLYTLSRENVGDFKEFTDEIDGYLKR